MQAGLHRFLGAIALCLLALSPASARDAADDEVATETAAQIATESFSAATSYDDAAWDAVAERAETVLLRDVASIFSLNRLRADIVEWRDVFSAQLGQHGARLGTLDDQIAALGPVPEAGDEAEIIANRRASLESQRDALAAPGLLAAEAYARADGLILEIDRLIRTRKTNDILLRTESPLLPTTWAKAMTDGLSGLRDLAVEAIEVIKREQAAGTLIQRLPLVILYLAFAYLMILRVRGWLAMRARKDTSDSIASAFFIGLGQLVAPLLGLVALVLLVSSFEIPGALLQAVLAALGQGALVIILGQWLSQQMFPASNRQGPLHYSPAVRRRARHAANMVIWLAALWLVVMAFLDNIGTTTAGRAVLGLPFVVVLSVALFRLGIVLGKPPVEDTDGDALAPGRKRRILSQICKLLALASPILALLGFTAAAEALLLPSVLSLGLIGTLVYLQTVVNDFYIQWATARGKEGQSLVPIFFGFILLMVSLPLLALIWGMQQSELAEIWTRFREGFAVGETRISPTDFLTFVLIFAAGYMLTRLIQGTLRTSVLPRTRLDLGGQNAVVAGVGYIGIGLAAIIAITSAGIDLSNLAIVAGALSVGIGFGLQNIVSNFVSGIILLIERPVSEGDWIEVGGQMGYVRDISVRSTRIETFDRTDVIIPNADLVSGQVTNWTRGNLVGRVIVPVGVAYGSDVNRVRTILSEIAEAHPMVLMTPPPAVMFAGFGASSLDFEIRAILRDVNFVVHTKSEMNFEIVKRFAEEGIEIPFPQQDVWLRNPETLRPPEQTEEKK